MPTSIAKLERIEVRPLGVPLSTASEEAARAWLADRQALRAEVRLGEVFVTRSGEFGVVAVLPARGGLLAAGTECCVGSSPVPALERVQLTYLDLAPSEESRNTLYEDFVRPHLLKLRQDRQAGGRFLALLAQDQVVKASGHEFGIRALDPQGRYGALDEQTSVYVGYVESPALAKVHVLPYEDTLPGAYSYDLFQDFLKPFFQEHPFAIYAEGDHFTYRGVRFRVMATDPAATAARVSSQTMVYCEGDALRPTVLDLMPPELRADLQRLPRGLQVLLLNTMAHEDAVLGRLGELDTVLRRGQGLSQTQIGACGEELRWRAAERVGETQQQCMVCLSEFAEGDLLRQLGCDHLFHKDCIDEWLQRSASCPICKQAVRAGVARSSGRAGPAAADATGGAGLLDGLSVVCDSGLRGIVLGFDRSTHRFRVAPEGGGPEQLVVPDGMAQRLKGVQLLGLQASELNGTVVEIVGIDGARGRYLVQLDAHRTLAVRPENCVLPIGAVVRVVDLHPGGAGSQWNGHFGRVVNFDGPRLRHLVAMQPRGQLLSVRPRNLRV